MSEALLAAIADATLWLDGRYDLGEYKARDKREPGRREKTRAELALFRDVARLFRRMAKAIRARLDVYPRPTAPKSYHWERKPAGEIVHDVQVTADDWNAMVAAPLTLTQYHIEAGNATKDAPPDPMGDAWWDEQEAALRSILLRHMGRGANGGARLFEAQIGLDIDQTQVNKYALRWATTEADHTATTIISGTAKTRLREALAQFVETPGYTVGDVMDVMRLTDPGNAEAIAITEITRAYSQGNRMAGEELQREFPDVRIIETWFTNNDELVCTAICEPLNDKTVTFGEKFDPANDVDRPPAHPRCRCWTQVSTDL
jgi:hypothetical protein